MKILFKKGQLSLPLASVFAGATFLISGLTSYFTSQMSTDSKISDAKIELSQNISDDRERISKLEEAISTIKTSQQTTEGDIKEILRLINKK